MENLPKTLANVAPSGNPAEKLSLPWKRHFDSQFESLLQTRLDAKIAMSEEGSRFLKTSELQPHLL